MDRTLFEAPETTRRMPGRSPAVTEAPSFEANPPDFTPPPTLDPADAWIGKPSPELGLRHYIRLWRRYRALVVVVMSLSLAVSVVRIVIHPRIFMATTTILPSGGQGGSGVLGLLASVTGVPPVLGGSTENSSNLFPRMLESRSVCLEVLNARYSFHRNGTPIEGTLVEYMQAKNIDEAMLGLTGLRATNVDKETGIISISVRTAEPELSAAIANKCVEELEKFNNQVRHDEATQNSSFIQEGLDKARAELSKAEDRLARFKEENVRMNSSDLEMELMRLTRDVTLETQVYVTLSNQAEVARLEEAKNLPIVRILDRAVAPALPVPAPKVMILAAGVLVGALGAILLIAGLELLAYIRMESRTA